MISRKHNSGIAYILTVSMIWLILSALSDVALSAWQPPIGIPAPSFGINETFRYYDVAGNRASGLTYRASPNGGFYTHYVDMNHINATDADPYGTATAPRLTMPAANTVIAGSVVEVHGGPYAPTVTYTLDGTSALPIFIRGDGVDTDPEFTDDLAVSNSYSIWENLLVNGNGGAVKIRGGNGNACEYISIRNCAILGQNLTSPVQIGQQSTSNYETNNIVLYKNTIDNDGFNPPDADIYAGHNIYIGHNSHYVYILENTITDAAGDGIGNAHGFNYDATHWYIGGNTFSRQQNGVDLKEIQYVVISQNTFHSFTSEPHDGQTTGVAVVIHKGNALGAKDVWVLFNEFYDCNDVGVHLAGNQSYDVRIIGNVFHDITGLVIKPYLFPAFMDEAQIVPRLLSYGYIDADGVVDPGYTTLSQAFKDEFSNPSSTHFLSIHSKLVECRDAYRPAKAILLNNVAGDNYVLHNTIYNCDNGLYQSTLSGTKTLTLQSNIISTIYSSGYHVWLDSGANLATACTIDYNCFYQSGGTLIFKYGSSTYNLTQLVANTNYGDNCTESDPSFTDAVNKDFSLQAGSPAIDAGIDHSIYDQFQSTFGIDIRLDSDGNTRLQGSAWDIGAYEGSSSNPNNPSPVLQAIGDKSVNESVSLTFTINATDPDSEPITYSAQNLPSGATLDSQTGDFAWTPSYTQAGSYSVTFRASDGNSLDSETITITVSNINRAPVLGAISDQSVNENTLLNFSVNATDPDGQTLTYSVTGLPNGAALASQAFTWTPAYNQAGTFALTFTVDDGQAQDSQAITITVNNVNRAPVFTAINNKSVWSDDPLTFAIDATDPDGDAVTYSVNAVPSGAAFITETFDWTPIPAQIGSYNVTFYASDGLLQDSEAITITVNVDNLAPTVTNSSPAAGAIQVPLNNLITLNVTDTGKGINASSVKIKFKTNSNPNNTDIYSGDLDHDITLLGDCRRIGNNADYQFIFQPVQDLLYNDQTITVTVNAEDLAGNAMSEQYSFVTEMHLFGQNKLVNTNADNNDRPVTVCDSSGNIWAAWHTGSAGSRDIYIGTLASGANSFGNIVQLTNDADDQCNPALALDSNDKLYVVWQDNRKGDWDVYISTSVDGTNWSTETMVNDLEDGQVNPFSNEINPAIVIDSQSPINAHVVWQDDLAGNQDICIAASSNGFTTKTISQITSDASDQVEPAITANSANTIYVVWTDSRNGSSDIYGAASNSGPWTNTAVVSNVNNQSSPAIAAESTGTILHLLWVDDTPGDNDIYYASSNNGFQGISGSSIIDDTSGADQLEPTIAITGTTNNNDLKVFAGWQDWRNTDTDLYFTELNAGSGTNIFVNDGGSNAYQSDPAIGIDEYGCSYIVWADDRSSNTDIYYAGSTFTEPAALASALVSASAPGNTTIGVDPQSINDVDDVSIVLPSGACSYDVDVSIVTIMNQQVFAVPCLGSYEFGPSGAQFTQPVTITIPYVYTNSNGSTVPYWFNSQTGTISQQGITNIRDIVISPTLHAISFETTHFTPYYLLGGGGGGIGGALGGGGGGGGCSVSADNEGNIVEFVLPYLVLIVVMAILKKRDARYRKIHI